MDRYPRRREPLGPRGPFDRVVRPGSQRDPTPYIIGGAMVVLAIIILVLFLPPFAIVGGGGGDGERRPAEGTEGISYRAVSNMPSLPEGLAAVSAWNEISSSKDLGGQSVVIEIPLLAKAQEASGLAFYAFEGSTWRRLAAATLINAGATAQATLVGLPQNVVVLRRAGAAYRVWGWLPPGAQVDPRAGELLTVLTPLGLLPKADGSLGGKLELPPTGNFQVYPSLRPGAAEDVAAILASPETRTKHAGVIVATVEERSLRGVDIDYGDLVASQREALTLFLEQLSSSLHQSGMVLSVTVPLPLRKGDTWDTGAYDWDRLGRLADFIKLAPERDQSVYRTNMSEVLSFVTQKVDAQKLLLVVSPYSHEKGREGTRKLTFLEAMGLANVMSVQEPQDGRIVPGDRVLVRGDNIDRQNSASGIRWDNDSATVSFQYGSGQQTRTVWVENAFSIAFKLELVRVYRLGGVALEDVAAASLVGIDPWAPLADLISGTSLNLRRPNEAALRPEWLISEGTLEGGVTTVAWRAPSQRGTYELSLIVSDGLVRVGRRLKLEAEAQQATPTPGPAGLGPALTPVPTPTRPAPEVETPTPTPTVTPPAVSTATPVATATATPPATPPAPITLTPIGGAPTPTPAR